MCRFARAGEGSPKREAIVSSLAAVFKLDNPPVEGEVSVEVSAKAGGSRRLASGPGVLANFEVRSSRLDAGAASAVVANKVFLNLVAGSLAQSDAFANDYGGNTSAMVDILQASDDLQ